MTWKIEPASNTPESKRFVRRLFERTTLHSYAELASLGGVTRKEQLEVLFETHWQVSERRIWVGRAADNTEAGLIWLQPDIHPVSDRMSWLVVCLAVEPAYQRQGLGRALLEVAQRASTATGFPRLRLFVDSRNAAALALYAECGFTPANLEMHWCLPQAEGPHV